MYYKKPADAGFFFDRVPSGGYNHCKIRAL